MFVSIMAKIKLGKIEDARRACRGFTTLYLDYPRGPDVVEYLTLLNAICEAEQHARIFCAQKKYQQLIGCVTKLQKYADFVQMKYPMEWYLWSAHVLAEYKSEANTAVSVLEQGLREGAVDAAKPNLRAQMLMLAAFIRSQQSLNFFTNYTKAMDIGDWEGAEEYATRALREESTPEIQAFIIVHTRFSYF